MTVHAASGDLHDALIRALAPVTRWLHPAAGDGDAELVNPAGVDVWDGQVGSARVDPDGTVHAYLFVQDTPGGSRQTRQVKEGTVLTYRPLVTVAAGTPRKARWAVDKVRAALDGAILTDEDGAPLTAPLHEGFGRAEFYDPGPLRLDNDPSPPRWVAPIQYATEAC